MGPFSGQMPKRGIFNPPWTSQFHLSRPFSKIFSPTHRCAALPTSKDPYKVLQIAPGSSFAQIKAAYYSKMKEIHPDVNTDRDTTEEAVLLNAAYAALLQGYPSRGSTDEFDEDQPDVFDLPEADATELFVNPFSCYNVNPFMWEELQEVAKNATGDPEEALRWAGAGPSENAIHYLSPRQLEAVIEELNRLGPAAEPTTLDACAFYLTDCLYRARIANSRFWAAANAR